MSPVLGTEPKPEEQGLALAVAQSPGELGADIPALLQYSFPFQADLSALLRPL